MVLTEWVDRDTANQVAAYVVDSPARGRAGEPPLLEVELRGPAGAVIEVFNAWHPQWEFVANADGTESMRLATNVDANLPVPYDPLLTEVAFTDLVTNEEVLVVDTLPALERFCEANLADADCEANVASMKSGPADPVPAGTTIAYTIEVSATGPNPARGVELTDDLPSGFDFISSDSDCAAAGTRVTCRIGTLFPGETAEIDLVVGIAPGLVHAAGAPFEARNVVTAGISAGLDPNAADDASSFDVEVVAVADLSVTDAVLESPDLLVVGEATAMRISAVASSAGPSSPMNATADFDVVVVGGAAGPSTQVVGIDALAVSRDQLVSAASEITCADSGLARIDLSVEIAPANSADTDPNLANNQVASSVAVECILPIAINIRPGQSTNSINAGSGVVMLGILTTEAGEYDLPLPFDASWVDEDSLVFAAEPSAIQGVGSPLVLRSRPMDVREVADERTRDGDQDLLTYFRASVSGLTPSDTQACVVGSFTRPDGTGGRFIGCDSVTVRP